MALMKMPTYVGGGGGGGIDITSPDLSYPSSGNMSSGFTIPVTQMPKKLIYNVGIRDNTYSFTYMVDFEKETAYRLGVSGSSGWSESKTFSDVILLAFESRKSKL
jgi:hypothetical protein